MQLWKFVLLPKGTFSTCYTGISLKAFAKNENFQRVLLTDFYFQVTISAQLEFRGRTGIAVIEIPE
jgi:hypothetical protein